MRGKHILYAAVGLGDLAVDVARQVRAKLDLPAAARDLPKRLREAASRADRAYRELAQRGEKALAGRTTGPGEPQASPGGRRRSRGAAAGA